ncbi:MAG: helix-turn-helix domain-containing protein [Pseudonocardia sp.]
MAEQEPSPAAPPAVASRRVLLTVAEAAEQLGIGKTTTYALVRSGEIESVLIGRLRRIHVDSVAAYAAQLVAKNHAA